MAKGYRSASGKAAKQASGVVTNCSSRVAINGSQAHSFTIGRNTFTIFSNDNLSPVINGDRVRFDYQVRRLRSGSRSEYLAIIPESLIVEAPTELDAVVSGQVYILSNTSMPGLLKIGFTTGTASDRAAALSGVTGVPTGFKVEWALPVIGSPLAVEQRAHAILAKCRQGKEFFRVSLEDAKSACIQSFAELYPDRASAMDDAFAKRASEELARREELARIQAQRDKEREEQQAREAFSQTREGKWLNEGNCYVELHAFSYEPNWNLPSFFSKLFGAKYHDYLKLTITATQHETDLFWSFDVEGRINEKPHYERKRFEVLDEAISFAKNYPENRRVDNFSIKVLIPTIFIDNPPELPPSHRPSEALKVASFDDLVVRPARYMQIGRHKRLVR